MPRLFRLALITFCFLGIALGVAYFQLQRIPVTKDPIDAPIALGGPFDLIDQDGKSRKNEDFSGKYMLVYFGYSFCPDICPMALSSISEAIKHLRKDRDDIIPIFITVDPKRDTVSHLKVYSTNFDKNILFLTGTEEAIQAAMKHYRIFASKAEDTGSTDYLMDHSTLLYLMDREGKFMAHFPHTIDGDTLGKALVQVLAQEKK